MAGCILVAEKVATTRILLKVILSAAHYDVVQAGDAETALKLAKSARPSLIMIGDSLCDGDRFTLLESLKSHPTTRHIPMIVLTDRADPAWRIAALGAGADELMRRPVREVPLLARIRSLLRAAETDAALSQREAAVHDLGFAEASPSYSSRGRIALVAEDRARGEAWRAALAPHMRQQLIVLPAKTAILAAQSDSPADIYVVEADEPNRETGLRLVAELRARAATRYSAVVIVHDKADTETSATALDLGANDLVEAEFNACEMALRLNIQHKRKQRADHLRASVEESLRLAVIDPLTGLFNRRYFDAHAARMLARANDTGRSCALLLADIDRFKAINDS